MSTVVPRAAVANLEIDSNIKGCYDLDPYCQLHFIEVRSVGHSFFSTGPATALFHPNTVSFL